MKNFITNSLLILLTSLGFFTIAHAQKTQVFTYDKSLLTALADTSIDLAQIEVEAPIIAPKNLNYFDVAISLGYPVEAVDQGIEGLVEIRILVDQEGKYVKHEIASSPSEILSSAVEARIKDLTFSPGIQNGEPVSAWADTHFYFRLTSKN